MTFHQGSDYTHDDCDKYAPRPIQQEDFTDCASNGHWLCEFCAHRKRCYCGAPTAFYSNRCEKCDETLERLFAD